MHKAIFIFVVLFSTLGGAMEVLPTEQEIGRLLTGDLHVVKVVKIHQSGWIKKHDTSLEIEVIENIGYNFNPKIPRTNLNSNRIRFYPGVQIGTKYILSRERLTPYEVLAFIPIDENSETVQKIKKYKENQENDLIKKILGADLTGPIEDVAKIKKWNKIYCYASRMRSVLWYPTSTQVEGPEIDFTVFWGTPFGKKIEPYIALDVPELISKNQFVIPGELSDGTKIKITGNLVLENQNTSAKDFKIEFLRN